MLIQQKIIRISLEALERINAGRDDRKIPHQATNNLADYAEEALEEIRLLTPKSMNTKPEQKCEYCGDAVISYPPHKNPPQHLVHDSCRLFYILLKKLS